jgi:N-succinyldiaminopimelate aminotransferase
MTAAIAPTSVFSTATRAAREHAAVNLAQGAPDFDPPEALVSAAVDALASGRSQYSLSEGLPELREAIAAHVREQHGVVYSPDDEVTVTVGATEAIWSTVAALVAPGDEVVLVEPFYELYRAAVLAAGGRCRYVRTTFPRFCLDLDQLATAFSPRTRLVVVNTPGNPSGRLLTAVEAAALGALAERHDAAVLSDETYEHIVFAGRHVPVATDPACRPRTITVSSISKTFSATGWRVGWALAAPGLTAALRATHQHVTFAAATPLQAAVAATLDAAAPSGYLVALRRAYAQRREVLAAALDRLGFETPRPDGGFFLTVGVQGDERAFCRRLLHEAGVAALPGSAFHAPGAPTPGFVRFAFCKRVETLKEAGARIVAALGQGAR